VESLVEAWNKVEGNVRDFLSELTGEDLARDIEFTIGEQQKENGSRALYVVCSLI